MGKITTFDDWTGYFRQWQKDIGLDTKKFDDYKFEVKFGAVPGDMIEFGEVLAVGEGADAAIGTPFVAGALVTAEVVDQGRGRTVIAFKKRRRQNSRRSRGHCHCRADDRCRRARMLRAPRETPAH